MTWPRCVKKRLKSGGMEKGKEVVVEKGGDENENEKDPAQEFMVVRQIAEGNVSNVYLALHRMSEEFYALKVMERACKMAEREKDILSTLNHPFLPSLFTHFHSHNYIFFATKYWCGGDMSLLRLAQPTQTFSVAATRFYAAEVIVAVEYLHKKGIVYRDLKPQNILLQDSGHIMLTDFDLSRRLKAADEFVSASAQSFVGTKEYMAPEILWSTGHGFPVDWWSLGILMYEMVCGRTPFGGANRRETFINILSKQPSFTPPFYAPLQDLIEKLLVKEPSRRLGSSSGADELKSHRFFHGLRWDELEFLSRPPLIPSLSSLHHHPPSDTNSPHSLFPFF